jgi:hypothetical protein
MKGDCNTVGSRDTKPTIANKFSTIVKIIGKLSTSNKIDDYVCFYPFNALAEEVILGENYKTGKGVVYSRPMFSQKIVEVVITESTTDPKTLLEGMISTKLGKSYTLSEKSSSGSCRLYSWGSTMQSSGYAGHCAETDGLTVLFFNICTDAEAKAGACNQSGQAIFDQLK